jgi:uncharacterized protein YkuJ
MSNEELAERLKQLYDTAHKEKNDRVFEHEVEKVKLTEIMQSQRLENKQQRELAFLASQAADQEIQDAIDHFDMEIEETLKVLQKEDPKAAEKSMQFLAQLEDAKEKTTEAFWEKQKVGDPLAGLKEFTAENGLIFE